MIDPEVQKGIDSITKLQQIGTSPIDIKTFKQDTKATIKANNAAIEAAKAQNATALDDNLKKRTLRTNVPTRVLSGDKVKTVDKVTQSLRQDGFVSLGTEKQPDPDQPGLQLTAKQQRIFKSTGMIKGEFSNGDIIRWMKRAKKGEEDSVFASDKWPVNKITGEKKSIEGFKTAINQSWKNANIDAKIEINKNGGWEFHRGHGVPAADFGSNWKDNIAPQPAYALEEGGNIGPRGMTPNVAQSDTQLKSTRSLQDAGIDGVDLKGAFKAYLLEDEPNIMHYINRTDPRSRGQVLHGVDPEGKPLNPEAEVLKAEKTKALKIQNEEIAKANVKVPELGKVKTPKDVFFNVVRTGARTAGQSPNPLANVAGDIVGAVMDGATYLSTGDKDALADFTLSGSQALISVGAGIIAVLPVPGARPGAYALMKVGDNIGKVERIWNMTREGRQLNKMLKAGETPTLQNNKKKPEIVSKVSGDEVAGIRKDIQTDTRINKSRIRIKR